MGWNEDRENRRVAQGERIVEVIEAALQAREVVPADRDHPHHRDGYRRAMIGLIDLFEEVAQDRIDRHEQEAAYDAGRN